MLGQVLDCCLLVATLEEGHTDLPQKRLFPHPWLGKLMGPNITRRRQILHVLTASLTQSTGLPSAQKQALSAGLYLSTLSSPALFTCSDHLSKKPSH